MRRIVSLFALTAGLTSALAVCALLLASPAQAAVFVVNSTVDSVDALPGDGVCDDASGACTLRAAVMETNALVGADLINVPAGTYVLAIPGTDENAAATGDLDIIDDLTLIGAGPAVTTIDAAGLDRVLDAYNFAAVSVNGLTITGGVAVGADGLFGTSGGGIRVFVGSLSLSNTTISGNSAGDGGGLFVFGGSLHATSVVVSGNTASNASNLLWGPGGGGGIAFYALSGDEPSTIASGTISGNQSAGSGGGVLLHGSELVLRESLVSDNVAGVEGGGVYNFGGWVTLLNSTVSGNGGGGIFNEGGTANLLNSTVSGNVGTGVTSLRYCSGGCYGLGICPCAVGDTSIQNSTVSENSGGGIVNWQSHVTLKNSAIANQASGADCTDGYFAASTSGGHNLDSDGTCNLTHPTDLSNTDPMMGPLQDNGGTNSTHALLPGSPAIDAIPEADCTVAEDQRGVARPQGDGCDIGAYEVTACADGLDNDGDGFVDYPEDPGCRDAKSVREDPACQDGLDNDGDGLIDFDGGLSALDYVAADPDPQCVNSFRNKETACGLGAELALVLPVLIWARRRSRGSRSATATS